MSSEDWRRSSQGEFQFDSECVKEDIFGIIMNLKSLAIRTHLKTDEPKAAYSSSKRKKAWIYRSHDIRWQNIQIMNPETVIRNIEWRGRQQGSTWNLPFTEAGSMLALTELKTTNYQSPVIPIDSIYTPVNVLTCWLKHVLDRLQTLTNWHWAYATNGTHCFQTGAVSLAAKVLSEHLKLSSICLEVAPGRRSWLRRKEMTKEKVLEWASAIRVICSFLQRLWRGNWESIP